MLLPQRQSEDVREYCAARPAHCWMRRWPHRFAGGTLAPAEDVDLVDLSQDCWRAIRHARRCLRPMAWAGRTAPAAVIDAAPAGGWRMGGRESPSNTDRSIGTRLSGRIARPPRRCWHAPTGCPLRIWRQRCQRASASNAGGLHLLLEARPTITSAGVRLAAASWCCPPRRQPLCRAREGADRRQHLPWRHRRRVVCRGPRRRGFAVRNPARPRWSRKAGDHCLRIHDRRCGGGARLHRLNFGAGHRAACLRSTSTAASSIAQPRADRHRVRITPEGPDHYRQHHYRTLGRRARADTGSAGQRILEDNPRLRRQVLAGSRRRPA